MVRLAAFGVVLVVLHLGRPIVIPILLATLIAILLIFGRNPEHPGKMTEEHIP